MLALLFLHDPAPTVMAQVQDTCKKWSQAAATPTLGGVREGYPFWTPEAVSYPVENTRFSDSHRRSHFRTPDRTVGGGA
jgi:hypothetical protein